MKNLNLNIEQLLKMSDEQIQSTFRDSKMVINLKKTTEKALQEEKVLDFMAKFMRCPKCKSPIEKYEG